MSLDLLPIVLSARHGNWRRYEARKRNKAFMKRRKQILRRDENTCRYCGFTLDKFMHVVNADQDYRNNAPDNLVTACSLCAQCFFIDSLGLDNKSGGLLIYLPEISQADLNHFARILFCALDKDSAYKSKLQSAYMSFKERAKPVETCFGPDSSQPQRFGQGMIDSGLSDDQLNHPLMLNLRLLPSRTAFKDEALYWRETVFAKVPL